MNVSVAMCTYNGSRFLREQLDSIAQQTRLPDELVICDDVSTDETPEIVSAFAATAPFRVRFVRNERNIGSSANFEQAMSLCQGDYIALCDQDDWWYPQKLERLTEVLDSAPDADLAFSDGELMNERSESLGQHLWGTFGFAESHREYSKLDLVRLLLSGNVVTGATVLLRSSARALFMPVPSTWVHDSWIALVVAVGSRIVSVPEPLIRYRVHRAQQEGVLPDTFAGRVRLAHRIQGEQHSAMAERFETLLLFLRSRGLSGEVDSLIVRRIQHLKMRATLPSSRVHRIPKVFSELSNYRTFARRPILSIIKDLTF
jgi:glycosyltransferase involved in cell wall biosynthesis